MGVSIWSWFRYVDVLCFSTLIIVAMIIIISVSTSVVVNVLFDVAYIMCCISN